MNKKVGNIINDMPCDIIRDLLPSYADGLTSDATNESIKAHVSNCLACNKILADMLGDESENLSENGKEHTGTKNAPDTPVSEFAATSEYMTAESVTRLSELPEIDYLKKIRRKGHRNILLAILAIVLVFAVGILLKLFVIGYAVTDFYGTEVELRSAAASSTSSTEKEVVIRGQFFDSATVYSRYKVKEHGGIREVIVYGSLPSFLHKSSSFEIVLPLDDDSVVEINGETILAGGQRISRLANELYKAKNPYIGDMPANNIPAELLSISSKLGSYTSELQTADTPYSWELKFGDSWNKRIADNSYAYENSLNPFEKLNDKMRSYACVLLALIDNCDEIKWSYTDEHGTTVTESLNSDGADELLGINSSNDNYAIKNFANSPLAVQKLLETVGLE